MDGKPGQSVWDPDESALGITAGSGEIVVALVGDEATVKRLRIRRKRVELHAENPDFEPIVPDPRELTLLGKVVEVHRRLEP